MVIALVSYSIPAPNRTLQSPRLQVYLRVMLASSPSETEQGGLEPDSQTQLSSHSSRLPNLLYILSFAPSYPSILCQFPNFIQHPRVLYTTGTIAALLAEVGLPAYDMIFGWWSNGIRAISSGPESIARPGSNAGWVMTIIGVAFTCTFTTFVICCMFQS
jgi:ATP-binding cassette subfamily B (MDR/TAP) protein 1